MSEKPMIESRFTPSLYPTGLHRVDKDANKLLDIARSRMDEEDRYRNEEFAWLNQYEAMSREDVAANTPPTDAGFKILAGMSGIVRARLLNSYRRPLATLAEKYGIDSEILGTENEVGGKRS